jgi:hypothetical protein
MARLLSGRSGLLFNSAQYCGSIPSTNKFKSKPGFDTSASTAPVPGSSATMAPRRSPKAFSATRCRRMSSDSTTLLPETAGVVDSVRMPRPAASISTCSNPVVPCSSRS